uniref:Megakaryocyte-associated tyrosine kinase n=1 Tax=Ficedula albicollis TaxID=59894 RepID=A0A803VT35_FICAL
MPGKHWPPGTQCVTKHDHTKPKPRELAFRKGDMVTIIEAVEGKGWYRARHNETGQEGLLAASALRERGAIRADPKLSLMPWFHGKISGVEAVQELQPPEDGLFLVRESVRHPGDYVLCVSFGKEVIHYRVVHEENTLSIDSQQYFSNLIDMIEVRPPGQRVPPVPEKGKDLMGSHGGRSLSCSLWFSVVFVTRLFPLSLGCNGQIWDIPRMSLQTSCSPSPRPRTTLSLSLLHMARRPWWPLPPLDFEAFCHVSLCSKPTLTC